MVITGGKDEVIEDTFGGVYDIEYKGGYEGGLPDIKLVSDKVSTFVYKMNKRRELDDDYLPFGERKDIFIKNIVLTLMKESGASEDIDKIFKEDKMRCPRRLYNTLIDKYKDLPMYPTYKPMIAFYDKGIFEVINDISQMCIDIEKYYYVVKKHIDDSKR